MIHPKNLTFSPPLQRAKGTSYARTRDRALRAWRRKELHTVVLYKGNPVTPAQVDWSKLQRDPTASGKSKGGKVAGRVSLDAKHNALLDQLAKHWGLTRAQALRRAVLDTAALAAPSTPNA